MWSIVAIVIAVFVGFAGLGAKSELGLLVCVVSWTIGGLVAVSGIRSGGRGWGEKVHEH